MIYHAPTGTLTVGMMLLISGTPTSFIIHAMDKCSEPLESTVGERLKLGSVSFTGGLAAVELDLVAWCGRAMMTF